jgi:hypothetical protein
MSLLAATNPQKKKTITRGINCPQLVLEFSEVIIKVKGYRFVNSLQQ